MDNVLLSQIRELLPKKEIEMRIRHILTIAVLFVLASVLTASAGYTNYAPIPRTGQTTSYAAGDDGDLEMGVAWPNPRFKDNGNGTVTDNLTGLIWLKNANCFGPKTWEDALSDANSLASGSCGLSDGSSAGDWRLPNVRELYSLVHFGFYDPAVPNTVGTEKWSEGDPFTGVQSGDFWSSTTHGYFTDECWIVDLHNCTVFLGSKDGDRYVWPVRGESSPCVCATGGHTEPVNPLALLWPWTVLVATVTMGVITALALKRRAA
jgi:hypothetical protein